MELDRRKIVATAASAVAVLLILSYAGQILRYIFGYPTALGFIELFYVDYENNVPTAYQFMALLSCSALIAVTPHESYRRHWRWLSLIFLLMALDEIAAIHEKSINPLMRILGPLPGAWQPLWVIAGLVLVAIVGIAYLRFVLHQPDRLQIMLAGTMFVAGAIGMEMFTATQFDTTDPAYKDNLYYATLAHIEEGLEMTGVVVFMDALLARAGHITVRTESTA